MLDRLDRAFRGQGAVVQVSGPPGIGKSALLREFIALARIRGAALAPVYSHSAAQTQALGVFTALVEVLLQLPGALGCSPEALDHCRLLTALQTPTVRTSDFDATLLRRRIERSVVELAQAITEEAPLLITVEDIHWADEASLERIRELAYALRECRALIILTGRTPFSRQGPWSNDIAIMELNGLERIEAEQLLARWSGYPCSEGTPYVAWCLQVADGHPLYLRELGDRWRLDGECYEMPPSLTSLLKARLDGLRPLCLRALQFCALMSRDSTLARLEKLLSLSLSDFTAVVEELERADVTVSDGDSFHIRHELLGEVLLARLGKGTLRTLYKQLALLFEEEATSTRSVTLSRTCAHAWLMAGETKRAGNAIRAAASHFVSIGLPGDAASLIRAYLPSLVDPAERSEVLRLYLEAQRYLCDWTGVIESAQAVAFIRGHSSLKHDGCELHVRQALWREKQVALPSLLSAAEDCATAEDADPSHRLQSAIQALVFADDLLDARAFDRIYARSRVDFPLSRHSDLSTQRLHLIFHTIRGDLDHAVDLAHQCVATAERMNNPVLLSESLRNSLIPLRIAGHFSDAFENGERALALTVESKIPDAVVITASALAMLRLAAGEPREASAYIARALEQMPHVSSAETKRELQLIASTVAFYSGDLESAAHHATNAIDAPNTPISRQMIFDQCMRAIAAVYYDRRPELETIIARLNEASLLAAPWSGVDALASVLSFALGHVGRPNEAASLLEMHGKRRRERYAFPFPLAPSVHANAAR